MALQPIQHDIAAIVGYTPFTTDEGQEPADTTLCFHIVEDRGGWPHIYWKSKWYPVPTLEECEEWVFDSICFTPEEDEVEPDHPDSWLSILGLI